MTCGVVPVIPTRAGIHRLNRSRARSSGNDGDPEGPRLPSLPALMEKTAEFETPSIALVGPRRFASPGALDDHPVAIDFDVVGAQFAREAVTGEDGLRDQAGRGAIADA